MSEREAPAWISEQHAGPLHTLFVRFVPRRVDGDEQVANTLDADYANVDIDADGNVLGVTLQWTDAGWPK